jgi:hypothetical protein
MFNTFPQNPCFSNQSDYPFKINLTASCNFGCECDMNDVQPVCGSNGLTYFSPCHAGCSQSSIGGNYSNCACEYWPKLRQPVYFYESPCPPKMTLEKKTKFHSKPTFSLAIMNEMLGLCGIKIQ